MSYIYIVIKMDISVIKISSKGQIVIPASWRKKMGLKDGEELLAIGEGDVLLLKKIEKTTLKSEFEEAVKPIRKKIKKLGITRKDVDSAIRKVRKVS
jgi:AbrB family looped-hinge helix DNA binding protein